MNRGSTHKISAMHPQDGSRNRGYSIMPCDDCNRVYAFMKAKAQTVEQVESDPHVFEFICLCNKKYRIVTRLWQASREQMCKRHRVRHQAKMQYEMAKCDVPAQPVTCDNCGRWFAWTTASIEEL